LVHRFGIKKVILPAVLGVIILFFIPAVNQRLSVGLSDPSSEAHLDLMKVGINKITESPIFGNGLYGFRSTLVQAEFQEEIHNYPHDIVLSLWVELGLLGLISFGAVIYFALMQYKKQAKIVSFAASVFLLILLVHGLVDTPYFRNDLSLLFWFVISLFYIQEK
jgi:O-antigen ligase